MVERDVGTAFVHKYYSTFSRDPVELGDMYSKDSIFAHASVGRNLDFVEGREDITATLAEISKSEGSADCKFTLHNVDCVPSMNGSVMLLVQGVMLTRETTREFAHTFLLGRNNNAFYIHNDIMRICEHDDEDFEEEEEEEVPEPTPTLPTVEEVTGETFEEPKPKATPAPEPEVETKPEVVQPRKEVKKEAKKVQPKEEKDDKPKAPPSSWAALVGSTSQPVGTSNAVRVTGGAVAQQQPKKKTKSEEPRKGGKGGDKPKRVEKGGKGEEKKERKPREANYNYYSLYLSKLPEGFKEEDVREVFGKFGEIKGMKYQDSQTMNAGGKRCFVDYGDKESMEAALKDEIKWNGVVLNVQERKSPMQRKEEKGSGSKGGRKDKPKGDKK